MSRRAVLWSAFVAVHVVVATLGFIEPNQPMGDVYFVYEPWALETTSGRGIPGITSEWIYPQLALVPMLLANAASWIAGYEVAWALLVTVCDAIAFALLVGAARSRGRRLAAWFWLAFAFALGPVGMYRLDAITVPIVIAACLWLVARPWLASTLLAIGMWIKVWPAAILLAAFTAVRRRLAIAGGALIVTALTLVLIVSGGGAAHAFGFIAGQAGRGLQIEAPVSAVYLWMAVAGVDGAFLYYDYDILTFQVTGPGVDAVIALMTPLLAVVVAGICAVGAVKAWRGASFVRLFPPLALSLVLALIVCNKVGSPQFLTWLIAPLAIGLLLDRRNSWRVAVAGLAAAALTHVVYPFVYGALLTADAVAVGILTARNVLTVALFVWAVVRLVHVPQRMRHASPVRS